MTWTDWRHVPNGIWYEDAVGNRYQNRGIGDFRLRYIGFADGTEYVDSDPDHEVNWLSPFRRV